MTDDDIKFNEVETEEAMRRMVESGGGFQTDEEIDQALQDGVESGALEVRIGEDGEKQYRLTDEGKRLAEEAIAEQLEKPPPRAEAFAHVYANIIEAFEEDSVDDVFAIAKVVIHAEHVRLADFLDGLVEGGVSDDAKLTEIAEGLRQGVF